MKISIQFAEEKVVVPPIELPSSEIGANLEFLGIVRELENGASLRGLNYEAYCPMARKRLETHLEDLHREHPCAAVWFIHRLGWVPVGETSLFIRVQSSHRAEAFALLGKLIDLLKQDVPIWKVLPHA